VVAAALLNGGQALVPAQTAAARVWARLPQLDGSERGVLAPGEAMGEA